MLRCLCAWLIKHTGTPPHALSSTATIELQAVRLLIERRTRAASQPLTTRMPIAYHPAQPPTGASISPIRCSICAGLTHEPHTLSPYATQSAVSGSSNEMSAACTELPICKLHARIQHISRSGHQAERRAALSLRVADQAHRHTAARALLNRHNRAAGGQAPNRAPHARG